MNHKDKTSLKEKNEIRGIPVISSYEVQAAGLQTLTRRERQQNEIRKGVDAEKTSDKQLELLLNERYNGLKTEVFDEQSQKIIALTKTILDLPSLAMKLHQVDGGYIKIALTEFPNFIKAVKNIIIRSLLDLPENALEKQYTEFLRRLEKLTVKYKIEELETLDAKELIKNFFDPVGKLFAGIEMVMQAIAVSAVKQSCESILESMVSKYEHHFNSQRNMAEDNINKAFFLAVNGLIVLGIVKVSLKSLWTDTGNRKKEMTGIFIKRLS